MIPRILIEQDIAPLFKIVYCYLARKPGPVNLVFNVGVKTAADGGILLSYGRNPDGDHRPSVVRVVFYSFFIFLIILGIKKEKIKRAMEKNTLKERSSAQFPETQTSFKVPIKNVNIKVPTMMPRPVPKT